jgi:hypothetical protein
MFTLLITYTTYVMFTSRECNVYTFIYIHHVFLLCFPHECALIRYTFIKYHTDFVIYEKLECIVYTFIYLHRVFFICSHHESAMLHLYLHKLCIFIMFASREYNFLHFNLNRPTCILRVFIMFTSQKCNVYTLFKYTSWFCYIYITIIKCLHFYLHTPYKF